MGKMGAEDRKRFIREALEEQRHLLRKSVKEMMAGDLIEAIRVATSLRVLVHESASSKPLLKQLNSDYLDLPILDEIPRKDQNTAPGVHGVVVLSVPVGLRISPEGVFLNSDLDPLLYAPSRLGVWWNRPSLILPGLGGFSRRDLVLGLANKEGGAHVDPDIGHRYQQLLDNKSLRIGFGEVSPSPLNLSRLMSGQAGIEMLDSLERNFPPAR
jgi:hypothetical protein